MQLVDGIGPYIRKMPINGILLIVPVSDGLDRAMPCCSRLDAGGLAPLRGLRYRRRHKNNIPSACDYGGRCGAVIQPRLRSVFRSVELKARKARKGETDDSCGIRL